MGNPRQRRKTRSSAHKTVQHARHAKRNLRKMKPIRGPKALKEAWDNKKTLRQNYAAMGLVGSLKQADSGGSERPIHASLEPSPTNSAVAGPSKLPRGFGKILRDADGTVIGVEIPEENDDEDEEGRETDHEPRKTGRETELVNVLEKLAETGGPVVRHSSSGEVALLKKLVTKHGQDFEAMAKDRRLNEWQRTAGQLQRACKKAGLI